MLSLRDCDLLHWVVIPIELKAGYTGALALSEVLEWIIFEYILGSSEAG